MNKFLSFESHDEKRKFHYVKCDETTKKETQEEFDEVNDKTQTYFMYFIKNSKSFIELKKIYNKTVKDSEEDLNDLNYIMKAYIKAIKYNSWEYLL